MGQRGSWPTVDDDPEFALAAERYRKQCEEDDEAKRQRRAGYIPMRSNPVAAESLDGPLAEMVKRAERYREECKRMNGLAGASTAGQCSERDGIRSALTNVFGSVVGALEVARRIERALVPMDFPNEKPTVKDMYAPSNGLSSTDSVIGIVGQLAETAEEVRARLFQIEKVLG